MTDEDPPSATLKITAVPQRSTLVSSVVEQLSGHIRSGAVAPGAKLPAESELCARFAVSRTVVREALAQLKAEELVESVQGLGLYVAQRLPGEGVLRLRASAGSRLENAREMLDFRAGLESQAARLAAERRTQADIDAMKAALKAVVKAERNGASGTAEDLEFHMAIARASRNAYIVQVHNFLMASLQDAISHSREIDDTAIRTAHFEIARREHGAVLEAIAARDPARAALAMQQHLTHGHARLLKAARKEEYGAANTRPDRK
jgi:GntR family transcriptional regulator, transcriptional repressor for pyruvate dehydrogenase complex